MFIIGLRVWWLDRGLGVNEFTVALRVYGVV